MIISLALLVSLVLVAGVIISGILTTYSTNLNFKESWSLTWSKPWFPVLFTLAAIVGSF